MFRNVRKKKNQIDTEAARELLRTERRGVFAVIGDNGYPYAVPVNFCYDETSGTIFFHGSKVGHKSDAIKADDRVCFTVYGQETIQEGEEWAPYLRSAVVFGRCRLVNDPEETIPLLRTMAQKYYPNDDMVEEEIARSGKAVQMYVITIEHLTGKQIQER